MPDRLPTLAAGLLLALALAALPARAEGPGDGAPKIEDGIAAQVGNDVVLISDITRITRPMEARIREAGGGEADIRQVRTEVLERLIERRLIEQLVRRAEIDAPDPEVDQAISRIAQENGLTLDELKESVEAQGLDFRSYREQIRGEIQRTKVLNGIIGARVRIEEEDLRELYQERFGEHPDSGVEVRLRHILVAYRNREEAESGACDRVEQALGRVRGGEPFKHVASEVSQASPETGGDVGWLNEETLAGWMAPVVRELEPGQTSGVVRTRFGCNLLHLVDRRELRRPDFEEVRPALREELYQRRLEAEYDSWIDKLRGQTYIERKGIFAESAASAAAGARAEAPLGIRSR